MSGHTGAWSHKCGISVALNYWQGLEVRILVGSYVLVWCVPGSCGEFADYNLASYVGVFCTRGGNARDHMFFFP